MTVDRKTLKVGDVVFFEGTHTKPTTVLYTDEAVTLFRTNRDVDFISRRTSQHEYTSFPTDLTDRNGRVVKVGDTLQWGGAQATLTGEIEKVMNLWCAGVSNTKCDQHDLWPFYTISNHCQFIAPRLTLSEFLTRLCFPSWITSPITKHAAETVPPIDLDS